MQAGPPPLTPFEKRVLLALTIAVAVTRLAAIARSLWDWDEALFALAVRDYDVTRHHPHPPGYPLFIAAGKLVHLAVADEFRALQGVVFLAACLLVPLLFLLGRELGFRTPAAFGAAVLFAFFPNVWLYGGTAFSDVPALAAGLAACTLLLAGRRDPRAYVAGAIVLGIATGIRPPSLLLGFVPALLATYARLRARQYGAVAAGMLLGALVAGGSYFGAALASGGTGQYVEAVRAQSAWVREVDSWRNPDRPPLREVAEIFWFKPVQQRALMLALAVLGAVSVLSALVRRRAEVLLTFLVFAPLALLTWLTLDFTSAARYAIAYMPAHALLAADGLAFLSRGRRAVQTVLTLLLVAWLAAWTWPALREQRTSVAPPVAAMEWALRNTSPASMLYVHDGLGPHAELLLGDRRRTFFQPPRDVSVLGGDGWRIDLAAAPGATNFLRPHGTLWDIARQRNFEASVQPVQSPVRFERGWYGIEAGTEGAWQWMAAEATATLAAVPRNGRLTLVFTVPLQALSGPPQIEVWLNGALVERFRAPAATFERSWVLPSRAEGNSLRIVTSEVANEAKQQGRGDTRDLGLRLDGLSWTPVP